MWQIDFERIQEWLDKQDRETIACIFAAFELLEKQGPNLGRPLVDTLKGTRYSNFKELRPASPCNSEIRIIFAFDPKRHAVMLVAGDKSKGKKSKFRWSGWYRYAIAQAECLYECHLASLED